jgi:PAS domain S-box-containing protein
LPSVQSDAARGTEAALAESEVRLELATSAAGIGIWDWDLLTNYFDYSPIARAICGFPADGEITYEMVRAATHPDDFPWTSTQAKRATDPAIRSREPYEYRLALPNGEVRWVLAYGEAQFERFAGGERAVRYVGTLQDITERRSRDLQHVKLGQRLKLAIDAGRMAVWSVDAEGRVEGSPEFNRLLKLPEDGQPTLEELLSRYYPGELERVQRLVEEATQRGQKYAEWEYRHLWPNDEVRWLLVRAELLRDADGKPAGSIGVIMDVTERRKSDEHRQSVEAELRVSERRLNAVLNNASVAILMMDERQECSYMNAAAERLTGYSTAETRGRPLHNVIHHTRPDGSPYPLSECPIDRAFPEENNVEGEEIFVHKDGTFFPVAFTASPIRDEASRTVGTIIEVRDIRAEKEAEGALQAQTTHLQILNETGAAIAAELELERIVQLVTDAGVRLTKAQFGAFFYNAVDQAGESLTLYTLSGASRADFEKFGHPRATAVFAPTFNGEGVVRSHDITADPRYGKNEPHHGMPANHLPVRSYLAVPVISRSGDVIGGLFFGHPEPGVFGEQTERLMVGVAGQAAVALDNARLFDAAQRANQTLEQRVIERTAELETAHEALRQAQKMEAVGQLTGGIAHDFNNLLTGVIGSLDMMQRQIAKGDSSKIERYATTAMTSAKRAAALTHRLLAFSRRQPLDPKPVNANRLVTGMEELLRRTIGEAVALEVVTAGGLWQTLCDPHQLESAILNLAINARDAMPDNAT